MYLHLACECGVVELVQTGNEDTKCPECNKEMELVESNQEITQPEPRVPMPLKYEFLLRRGFRIEGLSIELQAIDRFWQPLKTLRVSQETASKLTVEPTRDGRFRWYLDREYYMMNLERMTRFNQAIQDRLRSQGYRWQVRKTGFGVHFEFWRE